MTARPSRWLASLALLLVVPGGIWLAYVGSSRGLYPTILVPVAFGVILAVAAVALFAGLPVLRRWEDRLAAGPADPDGDAPDAADGDERR